MASAARACAGDEPALTIVHVDTERGFSGGEVQVFLLLEALRRRGHRCMLAVPPGSASEAEAARLGLECVPVPMRNYTDLRAIHALARAMREARADVAHFHTGRATFLGGWAARRAGVPAITTRRMDRRVRGGWRSRVVHRTLTRRTVAISEAVARCLAEGGVPAERVRTIPDAVDPDAFVPSLPAAELRRRAGVAEDAVVALVLANLTRRKGIDVLLDALAMDDLRAGPLEVWVAGDGPERPALEAQAAALGLADRVHFLGQRGDKADLLATADLVAMPSRREGMGVASLEAMAAARPVVASAVGGLAEAVSDGETGLLVPPDDAGALAAALERLVQGPELRVRLGQAGPARVAERYHHEAMARDYEALYREVIEEARAR